jgi:transglutaminase-like putative cysteine protease
MSFETFFRLSSYTLLLGGLLALFVSGGVGILVAALFIVAMLVAWNLEDSKWQLSERVGLIVILATLPLFYLDYKYNLTGSYSREQAAVATLARLILALAAIKLLQVKTDRDWFVLYLISFFEVLLAAGFSISFFLATSFVIYLFFAVTTIIAFEIRKSSRSINEKRTNVLKNSAGRRVRNPNTIAPRTNYRFPLVAVNLLLLTVALAVPLFFFLPRVGSAGIGAGSRALTTSTGFSEVVQLGAIARIQQSDEVVMRARIESGQPPNFRNFKWRGVALDNFDKLRWSKFRNRVETIEPIEGNFFRLETASRNNQTILQTIILEPLDTPTIFGLPRMLGVQGNFETLSRDRNESVSAGRTEAERISYRVISDAYLPPEDELRRDNQAYNEDKKAVYLQLPPQMDERFEKLTREIIEKAGAKNRYDAARAVESYLQTNFGYTLDLKASGSDPLADFLFNVKEGHCEYFASAMAIMLRTHGIATRVVNGFQGGQYNDQARRYIIRQKDAHSWVEVYFPQQNVWVPFDPTPAGASETGTNTGGIYGAFSNYIEALETMWIEYVVAYDNQGQRSLARSFRQNVSAQMFEITAWLNSLQRDLARSYNDLRGEQGSGAQVVMILYIVAFVVSLTAFSLIMFFLIRRLWRSGFWKTFWQGRPDEIRIVEFYARMLTALREKGFVKQPYQTPIEFADSLAMPEAMGITLAYNSVRFGKKDLSGEERSSIESWLAQLEGSK